MRYLSSVSLALVVLMALACTATPVEKSQPIQSSAAAPTPEPKSAIEQVRVGPYGQFEFLISDDTSLTAYRVKDKLGVDGLESRANPETGLVEVRPIDGDWLQVQPAYRSPLGELLPLCSSIAPDLTTRLPSKSSCATFYTI